MGRPAPVVAAVNDPLDQTTQRLRDALQCGNEPAARAILAALHPADIADCIDRLEREARLAAFALLSDAVAAEVIDETGIAATDDLLAGLGRERLSRNRSTGNR